MAKESVTAIKGQS